MLKLHNVDEARVGAIIADLVKHQAVNWVARFDGPYDIGFTIRVTSIADLSAFVDSLKERYHRYIHGLTIAINIEVDFLPREYITASKIRTIKGAAYTTPALTFAVDQLDLGILRKIANDAHASATDIARQTGVTSETVQQRILRLEKAKVISRYTIAVNSAVIGELNFYVFLYMNFVTKARLLEFITYCKSLPRVQYFIKALGEWDYELNLEVQNLEEYRSIMMELTRKFSDIIRDYRGLTVSKIHKFTLAP